jgi:RibD domain-containing protein
MKRLILQMQMSAGRLRRCRRPDVELGALGLGASLSLGRGTETPLQRNFAKVDTVLLSGPMAPGYISHWTEMARQRAGDPDYGFTQRVVAAQKRVISQSLAAINHPRASIGRGSLLDEVTALQQQTGEDIICFGGVSFASALLDANVVDELQFYVNPYAVGAGRSIFSRARPLQGIDATAYPCGVVVQRYRPA